MSKVSNISEALERFGGTAEYFVLENDGQSETARLLHHDIEDEMYFICHEVKVENRNQYIECTQEADCPLCKQAKRPFLRLFIQLELRRTGEVKIWDRGKKMVKDLVEMFNQNGPLNNRYYDIERKGAKNDMNTSYQFHPFEQDDMDPENMPERLPVVKRDGIVWPMSYYQEVLRNTARDRSYPEPQRRDATPRRSEEVF